MNEKVHTITGDRSSGLVASLKHRRQKLAAAVKAPIVLWSGGSTRRNFPANTFPFRCNSHFLYFAGIPLQDAAIRISGYKLELFIDEPAADASLWHGEMPTRKQIARKIGADYAYPLSELANKTAGAATVPVQDLATYQHQCWVLGRSVGIAEKLTGGDRDLANAIVNLRLHHDALALEELRQAAAVTVAAHWAGMKATLNARTEAQVRGAIEGTIISHNLSMAYSSIVTVHGEVLHAETYNNTLRSGDLLLADVGAETAGGWASDVTRTWAVSGKFSPTQGDIYDVVLEAHDRCIAKMQPGVEFREVHLLAAATITEGLVDLGILRGDPENLVAMDAHALFFPHGVGHLLGLDVHDMEDLGDLAGYALGRKRSDRFGLSYLRLDRPLNEGMLVTIEPGFYRVPAILNDPQLRQKYRQVVDWERLAQFSDVRGIRIEDDVLITSSGTEVLTAELPTKRTAIEGLLTGDR